MKILVTGANGFIGSALRQHLMLDGHALVPVVRKARFADEVSIGELGPSTDWKSALRGCDAIVHLAARVHVMNDRSADPLREFRRANVEITANLARQAADAGIRRLVFLSSIKVNGESTESGRLFKADDLPLPQDPYGLSKLEAEQELVAISRQTGIETVIIRPPLVYGAGVKANFKAMMRWLDSRMPLPFGAITHNRRSLVALDNLVSLISTSLIHPAAANQTFLVSDGEDLSTAELLRRMGFALGKPARLFTVPPNWLKMGAMLFNKQDVFQRLCGSLQVDIDKTVQLLDWRPVVSVDDGLRVAVQGMHQ